MIVLDSSAVIAILRGEPEQERFVEIIDNVESCHMSAATLLETRIVLFNRKRESATHVLDAFIADTAIDIVDVTRQTTDIAFEAFLRYGKGQGSGASLNFGDCFSYALAKQMDLPLLFKGNDFSQTDIVTAASIYS
ncbi:MAG: type II toxin-antitoxin system VapC family toxin [Rhodospirillaceae bacterium]|nr:type II toxin-antitoxin system VapC family toxin [Rhodospirillaceae bacterium]MBT4487869.1 type II toxin-antitoxin system VapC family toxin [Rhodospirillaceae bacterium]MBT5195238.1 type II toxin-antitoxin system VapC family toxin [Rhodospirillaceae bacterium]MBT5898237.1 type II toxin-antitoxin system VapC family toxin [Rhodospirillaceae bacterium]MBT6426914.1 type II toxin-antitoxin system VapC family toxin [Rhodospirillaceae bacterium]